MTSSNARPMTNATASSTMLPLRRKSLNSLIMVPPSIADLGHLHRTTPVTLRCSELPGSDLASHEMEADTCYRRHPEWRRANLGRPRSLTLYVALILGVVAVASPACGGSKAGSPSVQVAFNKKLDQSILVDSRGLTLYLFTADSQGGNNYKPSCYDDATYHCSKAWLPLRITGAPRAGPGVKASLLG